VNKKDALTSFPTKRVFPVDGMAVTADVWEEAHSFHRKQQQFHAMLNHGPGVVTGLEVIGSDPPDSSLYVLPGIAVDSDGRTIVLPEPMAYDLGESHGLLYLLLTYEESSPQTEGDREDGPSYVYIHYGIEAVSTLPNTPFVELARIRRQNGKAPIVDPKDAVHPVENEIDQRFRREVGASPQEAIGLAVSYAGGHSNGRHGRGTSHLARALRRSRHRVWVDDGVALGPGLEGYALVYLVGQEAFQLSRDEMNALYAYVQGGGTVLVESCRQDITDGDPPADASFSDLLASMGVQLEELPPDHRLLVEPFLFTAPPPGFETEATPRILIGDGVIYSSFDYGCLWGGHRRDGAASREEIRAAMEWGSNIVTYAIERRRTESKGSRGA
jgi:hypothetical protein